MQSLLLIPSPMSLLHQVHNVQSSQGVARGETRRSRTSSRAGRIPGWRQPQSLFLRPRNPKVHLFIAGLKWRRGFRNSGPPLLFGLKVIAPMPILIVTSGPHHGNVGSGIGEPGRKAKGITQYRIVFISSWSPFAGIARSLGSGLT